MTKQFIYKRISIVILVFQILIASTGQIPINGLQTIGLNFGLGGSLTQNTNTDISTYNYVVKNDSTQFLLGTADIYSLSFPFFGLQYDKGYFGRLDLRSISQQDQWTVAFIDSARQISNGLNVRKEQFSLSVYDNINVPARYEYGFTGYNTNADHFCFDRVDNIDLTLLKAHKDYARIQHYFDVPNQHYAEVIVNDKIYLQTDADTALIANGDQVILPGKGTAFAYFDNSVLKDGNSVKGSATQTMNLTTGVLLNKPIGYIRTVTTFLSAGASAIFTITNNYVKANSIITVTVQSASTGTPYVYVNGQGAGWFSVKVCNINTVQTFNNFLNINFIIN